MEDNIARNKCKRLESSSLTTSFSKKMKFHNDICFEKLKLPSSHANFDHHHFFSLSQDNVILHGGFLTQDSISGVFTPSLSSSNDSTSPMKSTLTSVDLEVKNYQTGSSSTCINNKFSRDTSSFYDDSDEVDSSPAAGKTHRKIRLAVEKIPCQAEIDEFFAESEKKEQKRFADKYNFDVVKDLPFEGRYQWVRLKP